MRVVVQAAEGDLAQSAPIYTRGQGLMPADTVGLPIQPYSIRIPGRRVSQPPEVFMQSGKARRPAAIYTNRE